MKVLFTFLVTLAAATALALVAHDDPGYVLLGRGNWTVETSLALFVVAILVAFGGLYALLRLLARLVHTPGSLRGWRSRRRNLKARAVSRRGQLELAEGRWRAAERHLLRYAEQSDSPLVNYLGAARAAQKQDEPERRDQYLLLAHQSTEGADIAVELTQAELQLAHGQHEQALASLMHLRQLAPKHPYVLNLLTRLYRQMGNWGDLLDLVAELRKRKVFESEEIDELERRALREHLGLAAASGNLSRLREAWGRLPRNLRDDEELVRVFSEALLEQGQGAEAEPVLRRAINRRWSPTLVLLYGKVEGTDAGKQLGQAEEWLGEHERDPVLLLTLGRLSQRNRLWGKAKLYYESSLEAGKRADTYRELGQLLEQLDETDKAMECYREGMQLVLDDPVAGAGSETVGRPAARLPFLPAAIGR